MCSGTERAASDALVQLSSADIVRGLEPDLGAIAALPVPRPDRDRRR